MGIYNFDARLEKAIEKHNDLLQISEDIVSHIDEFIQTQSKTPHNSNFCLVIDKIKKTDLFVLKQLGGCKSPIFLQDFELYYKLEYLAVHRLQTSFKTCEIYKCVCNWKEYCCYNKLFFTGQTLIQE